MQVDRFVVRVFGIVLLAASCGAAALDSASLPGGANGTDLPVSTARDGFTPEQVAAFHAAWNWQDIFKTGDASLYMFLHICEFYPTISVPRRGSAVALEQALDSKIGAIHISSPGTKTLDEYLAGHESRAQGMVVVHQGRIVFEQYPGMREEDSHLTASVAKTMASLVISLLEEGGKIDVQHTIGSYVPELKDTAWDGIKVIDVLNMSSGLDVAENEKTRGEPLSNFNRFLKSALYVPGPDGKVEKQIDIIRSAKKAREPGRFFEYSSINTQVLMLLAQAVEIRCWADIFEDRVWSKLTAEGDMQFLVTFDGLPIPCGLAAVRLRDLARFGMLYTPSWSHAARQPVVTPAIIEKIRAGAQAENRPASPANNAPVASSRQWDAVFKDGSFFKGGANSQGLYVSPDRDLVIAWFSTAPASELLSYSLEIAKMYQAPPPTTAR